MPEEGGPAAPPATETPAVPTDDAVTWGFRLLAGRPPVSPVEFAAFKALPDLDAMRRAFTNIPEYHAFFSAVLTGQPSYTMPLFLLRPPRVAGLEWRFSPPDLDAPTSQLCTASQLTEPAFRELVEAMGTNQSPSRALWEQAWVVSILAGAGLIGPGRSAIALGARRERVAALLASRGVHVLATGRASDPASAEAERAQLFYPEILPLEDFDQLIELVALDPERIGSLEQGGFDACWSIGLPDRLGSVAAALDLFKASLAPLRPGGLALHTFAFNLTSDGFTWELPDLVVLRRRDIEDLAERLQADGHRIVCLNTHPGCDPADEVPQTMPAAVPGLRQRHGAIVATSFGLAIRKAG